MMLDDGVHRTAVHSFLGALEPTPARCWSRRSSARWSGRSWAPLEYPGAEDGLAGHAAEGQVIEHCSSPSKDGSEEAELTR